MEEPRITSQTRWEDVSLSAGISAGDLEALIFSVYSPNWRKTAMVIGNTLGLCKARNLPIDDDAIGARIVALAEAERLEKAGDLRKWRHSEVRLTDRP